MDITSNPLIVTAADCAAAAVVVWTGNLHVKQVLFSKYTNPNDSATIQQTSGRLFAYLSGAADLEDVRSNNIEWARGLTVPKGGITSGQVLIYIM